MRVLTKASAVSVAASLSLAACGGDSASDKVACKNAKRVDASALLTNPPSGYEVEKVPDAEAKDVLKEFPQEGRDEISGVTGIAAVKGQNPVVVYALTSAKAKLDPKEELKGFRQTAQGDVEEIEIAGQEGAMQTVPEGTVAFGTTGDCGAIMIVGPKEDGVREIAGALEAPKT